MIREVSIIDYGSGNILSVRRAFEKIGCKVYEVDNKVDIENSKRLVLPGVGSFPKGMEKIKNKCLIEPIKNAAENGIPILGICLGMQMLLEESSEFKNTTGLGLISGRVDSILSLSSESNTRVPRIGWFEISSTLENNNHQILDNIKEAASFYFVHSFLANSVDRRNVVANSKVSGNLIGPAILARSNVFGFQFHPEKSGENGLQILKNFVNWV